MKINKETKNLLLVYEYYQMKLSQNSIQNVISKDKAIFILKMNRLPKQLGLIILKTMEKYNLLEIVGNGTRVPGFKIINLRGGVENGDYRVKRRRQQMAALLA